MKHVRLPPARRRGGLPALFAAAGLVAAAGPARAEPVVDASSRPAIVREALARSPGLKAAAERVRSMRELSRADGRLPDPELMFQIWQVPFAHPLSLGDSQMIMAAVSQTFPAPGTLSARAESRDHAATAEEAMVEDRARDLVRDVEHAYADLTEALARHRAHLAHREVAAKIVSAAQARQTAGGPLDDVAQSEMMLARLDADIASEAASVARAKARLNGFLARPFDAPLADAEPEEPTTVTTSADELVRLAATTRPDLRAASARIEAERAALTSAAREASLPAFTASASYFAPTTNMPFHGYGVSAAMTLPWVWGGSARREDAQRALARAVEHDAADTRLRVGVDVGTAAATAHAAAERLRVLRGEAQPAAKRALDVTLATYGAGRGDLLRVLRAEQAVVDTDVDIVAARATLEHALADLDWAVGAPLRRTPLDAGPTHGAPR